MGGVGGGPAYECRAEPPIRDKPGTGVNAGVRPLPRDLILYPDEGPFSLVISPAQIVPIRAVPRAI